MKKSLILLAALGLSGNAAADTLLGLYAGAQLWNFDAKGGFADESNLVNYNFDRDNSASLYVALEHPVPMIPNIKIRRTDFDNEGTATLTGSYTFGDQTFTEQSNLLTQIDLTNTDYILYYELFDNDLITFDFGLNIKDVDGTINVQDASDPTIQGAEDFSGFIPLLYSKFATEMPLTGLGFYAEGNYLSIDDHTVYEYQAALTYYLMDNLALDMRVQLGYRAFKMELNDLDGVYTDLEFKGPFAGIEFHF
ncbi:TIGR04219 family outer membrane beta-barrel protein [Neptunicella marina]|uniref:TIGR04219 family outer membrane beta-barrel protein n=1 Tax=Neptunicella marina TaxID=2125989 RepID=A0A8J6IWR8_9ALTE|nr:TIGR04219 family outer membrane beta-barrel protein [Neptunicella marina]MBC3767534.1 TIGR04219 family outer membrane beta-barrel protein [Neptunicella marina]